MLMIPLETCKCFEGLCESDMAELKQAARDKSYQAGDVIFKEGDEGDGLYFIGSGKVRISAFVREDDRRTICVLEEGEIFGEMAVIEDDRRSATAIAEEDVGAVFIPRDKLLKIFNRSPVLSQSMVREISHRLREFNRHYVREVLQSERLALVGRFARSIVHDLKNPLNIIGIAADMAGMDSANTEMRIAAKKRIRKQVDRIGNMITELLEFTRGSQSSFVLAATDYPAFIAPVTEELQAEVALKNVILTMENKPPLVRVASNPQRLARVFYNLAHNATDAMPNGGNIIVRFGADEKWVTTELEDTGPGIPPEMLERMFEPFFTHGKAHGTGLGLSICKRIIEDHQGLISACNRPGGGAIFSFKLPILKT